MGAKSNEPSGCELLIRLKENDQIIPPNAFLSAADRFDLSTSIDEWVVSNALKWLETASTELQPFNYCSMNLSGHSISDGRFVSDILNDPISHAMVDSINQIAHLMGKQTIGEFVEDERILKGLTDIGVDYGQGDNGIGKPVSIGEYSG
ncbi:MAG: EAL domain-containing protein (putative c-di-GMP-specific phosphodiesterase class I) [Gammaproteobacteria bacterium]